MFQNNQIQYNHSHNYSTQSHISRRGMPVLRYWLFIILVMVVGIGLFGCQPIVTPSANSEMDSVANQTDTESTLVIELPISPTTLDPQQTRNQILAFATFHLYDTLLTLDQSQRLTYTASLSTAIPDTNDSGNYIFQLRTGVLFSNGASFTATHVYSSWQQRKENMSDPWSLINNVQILNEQTVQITPQDHIRSDHFLNRVAPGLIIVHPHSTAQQPIGTGPYQLTNWTNDMIEMMRNPHYTREKENFGIDHVRFQHYPSLNDALESADVILGLTITQTGALSLSAFETITNPVTYIYKLYGLENPELTFNIEPAYKSLRKAVDLRMYKRSDKIFFDPLGADKIWQDFTTKNGPVEFKIYEDTELTSPFIQSFESQLDAVGLNTDVDNLPFSGESGKFSATEIPLFTQTIIAADNTMDMEVIDPLFEDGAIITVARQDQIITLVRNDPLNPQRGEPWINPCDICVPTDDPPTSAGPTFIPIGTGPSGPSLPPTPQSCYWLYVGYGTSIWVCS